MILDEPQIIDLLKVNQTLSSYTKRSREESEELKALVKGKRFTELLISKIEQIEGEKRAIARKKYSRSITDFFERLLRLIDNVYHSNGGSKYYDIKGKDNEVVLSHISKVRDGMTLQRWLETYWVDVYHCDPAGVIFLEYKKEDDRAKSYPTYKSINTIRDYKPKGQKVDYILFEPINALDERKNDYKIWRLVDDVKDYQIIQRGDQFMIDEENTTEHPFGQCPAIINSNIIDILDKDYLRKSPIDPIVELCKEYARDQSIKTIFKFLHGIPIHWRYVTTCRSCHGTKKDGNNICKTCDGKGFYESKDVTDMVNIPTPKKDDQIITPDISGYISPDLDTWTKYNEELKALETVAFKTHWGTHIQSGENETATGRFIDVQPVMNRLNKYADVSENIEKNLTEWIVNGLLPSKDKNKAVYNVNYGRRYIIEGADVILDRYEKAKEKGDNTVILDRLFNEYLNSKYKNDPKWLIINLKKANIEPYIHYTIEQVNEIFGNESAQKKGLFDEFWRSKTPEYLENTKEETILNEFQTWLSDKVVPIQQPINFNNQTE